jgi:hypothetical protein
MHELTFRRCPPPDLECADILPFDNVRVTYTLANPDPHGFDPDHNGVGCESG